MKECFIGDFEIESVKVYKQAEALIKKKADLAKAWNLLHDNYDSVFTLSAEAYSNHNYNQSNPCTIAIPLDVLFDNVPTKEDAMDKIISGINKVDLELYDLYLKNIKAKEVG